MKIFWAVTIQTIRSSLRSKVFYILLALTLLSVFWLPYFVKGPGTATGDTRVALLYSLQAVSALLSLTALWLGCTGVSRDVETHRLHLVFTKPALPWIVWLGKWAGVFIIVTGLLLLSAGSIYGLVQWRVAKSSYPAEEMKELKDELLVGRRIFTYETPNYARKAAQIFERRKQSGELPSGRSRKQIMQNIMRKIKGKETRVEHAQSHSWRFENLPSKSADKKLYVRYKVYVKSTSSDAQRMTNGVWLIKNPDNESQKAKFLPKRVAGGSMQTLTLPASVVSDNGTLILQYRNLDPGKESVIFQREDGPKVLIRACGFLTNYAKGVGLIIIRLALFTILGCAAGALFSTPVALFFIFSYLGLSVIVNLTIGEVPGLSSDGGNSMPTGYNMYTYAVTVLVDKIVVSLDSFNVPHLLTKGYLIETTRMARAFFLQFLLKSVPLGVLAVLVLSTRELGKVIRR